MKKFYLIVFILSTLTLPLLAQSDNIYVKVGLVDLIKIFQAFPKEASLEKKVQELKIKYQEDLQRMKENIALIEQSLQSAMRAEDAMGINTIRTKLEMATEELETYKRLKTSQIDSFSNSVNQINTNFLRKVLQSIEKLAKSKGFRLILNINDNPNIVYYSEDIDLTEEIIRRLKREL